MSTSSPRLFVRREAKADLHQAYAWYEARNPGLGDEFVRSVSVQFAAIERAPERFPVAADDIRKAVLPRFPYLVYFVILRSRISVLAVMHARRDPSRWQSRR